MPSSPHPPTRIARVESSLTAATVIKGQEPGRWTLAERMAHYAVPGVSVAVLQHGEIEWAKGYGVLQAGDPAPVTPDTRFQAASISKPVSALGALCLVEQGLLALDTDVNTRLTTWQVPECELLHEQRVTLRRLVSHTAGLTVHGFGGYPIGAELPTVVQILDGTPPANSAPVRVDIPPSSRWRYSGGGYTVMQQLLVDITGKAFPDLLRETVLQPLGMAHSTFAHLYPDAATIPVARGHQGDGTVVAGGWHIYPELAAAGLWTTPSDLLRFAQGVIQAYAGKAGGVISPAMAREMLTMQARIEGLGREDLMGLGVMLQQRGGVLYFSHGGSNEGFRCHFVACPETGQGVAVMTNSDNGSFLIPEIIQSVAAEYGWPGFEPVERETVPLDPEMLAVYAGEYELAPGINLTITLEDRHLMAQLPGSLPLQIHPASQTEFFFVETDLPLTFIRDEVGAVSGLLVGSEPLRKVS